MDVLKSTPSASHGTIRRGTKVSGQWQDFIDREQVSMDSFGAFRAAVVDRSKRSSSSNRTTAIGEEQNITRYSPPLRLMSSNGTLPRSWRKKTLDSNTAVSQLEKLRLPLGIEELEKVYAPMKNLSRPLPSAKKFSWNTMPAPHPLGTDLDDQQSEVCSVIADIPPPPAPVQSHALLEESLGHLLPAIPKLSGASEHHPPLWGKAAAPPLPPRRTSSKLSLSRRTAASQDAPVIYANAKSILNRASLMSTGSSGESSGGSGSLSPATPLSGSFPWWSGGSPSPSSNNSDDQNIRSVSQMGDIAPSEASGSHVYVRMSKRASPRVPRLFEDGQKRLSELVYALPETRRSKPRSSSAPSSRYGSAKASRTLLEFKELLGEVEKKRQYRVGLNLFNSQPELGVEYLVQKGFLELSPPAVATFLKERSVGLARDKVGEYLGNLQSPFAMKVLSRFMDGFDFSGVRMDKALRVLLRCVTVPGEAQKIERMVQVFGKRYGKCNPGFVSKLKSSDSIFVLSFGIILLNTDLHTPSVKEERKMTLPDFARNLEGVDSGASFDPKLLRSIYKAVKKQALVGGEDHVGQTKMIQKSIIQVAAGKKPPLNIVDSHRRLVCLCRLHEVVDINAAKKPSALDHRRDIFLFNDLLVVAKEIGNKSRKKAPSYAYKDSFGLSGLDVTLFHTPVFDHGVQISRKATGCILLTLNAGSEHDRYKFVMDLQESIFETNQMEQAMAEISAS